MKTHVSAWVFGCSYGFQQKDCSVYEHDEQSRGYGRFAGCVSCKHRIPHNNATTKFETSWQDYMSENK